MHNALHAAFDRLFRRKKTPSVDDFLALGKALLDAHIRHLTDKGLLGDHYEAIMAMNLIYAAVRHHNPLLTKEQRSRTNDRGYLQEKLQEIEGTGRWPIVRGELVKYSKLVFEELKARTPDDAPGTPLTQTEEKVLTLIRQQPRGCGITGRQIINQLCREGFPIEQSTLTRHIIPRLKRLKGVRNRRGVGYFVEPA